MQSSEGNRKGFIAAGGDATRLFWTLFDNIQLGLVIIDPELRLSAANDRALELLQVPREVLQAHGKLEELFRYIIERGDYGDGDPEALLARRMAKIHSRDLNDFDRLGPNNRLLNVRDIPAPDGGFISIITDVTDIRDRTADAELANAIVNSLPNPVYAINQERKFEFANDAFLEAYAVDRKDVVGKTREDLLPADKIGFSGKGSARKEARISYADGHSVDAVIDETHAPDTAGKDIIIGQITDISESKLRERQLDAVLSKIDFGVLFMDSDLNKQIMNDRAMDMWGFDPSEVEGDMSLREILGLLRDKGRFVLEDDSDECWEEFVSKREDVAREGAVVSAEYPLEDGRTFLYSAFKVGDGRMLTYYDITKLKTQENELRQALKQAQMSANALDKIGLPISIKNEKLEFVFANEAYSEKLGYEPNSLLGKSIYDILPLDAAKEVDALDRNLLRQGGGITFEEEIIVALGQPFPAQTLKSVLQTDDGERFVMAAVTDISELKKKEKDLRQALDMAELSQQVLDQLASPLVVKNQNLEYVMANAAFCKMIGIPKDALYGSRADKFSPKDRARRFDFADRSVIESGTPLEYKEQITGATGDEFTSITRKTLVVTKRNEPYSVTTVNDVTTLQQALEKAELSEVVLNQLSNPIVVKDANLKYVMVNDAFCALSGRAKEDVIGYTVTDLLTGELSSTIDTSDREVLENSQPQEYLQWFEHAASGEEVATLTKKTLAMTNQSTPYLVTVFNDVSKLKRQEAQLRKALEKAELSEQVLDNMQNPVSVKDRDLRYSMVNNAMAHLLNAEKSDIIGKTAFDFPNRLNVKVINEAELGVLRTGKSVSYEAEHYMANGEAMAILVNKAPVILNNEPNHVITVINDVTTIKEREYQYQAALKQAELTQMVLDQVPVPVMAKDETLRYVLINAAFSDTYGVSNEETLGKTSRECFDRPLGRHFEDLDEIVLRTGKLTQSEDKVIRSDGTEITGIVRKTVAETDNGDRYVIGVLSDVSELKEREEQLVEARRDVEQQNIELEKTRRQAEFDALHDSLTNLPNRRYLDRKLQDWMSAGQAERLALLQIDLDRFKEINDTLGHAAGDYVLQHVAGVLSSHTEEDDFVARIGGDEFVILRHGETARTDLEHLAEELITELNKPVPYYDDICRFGASIGIDIGIASTAEAMEAKGTEATIANDASRLLMNADIALYRAKQNGRGRFTFFSKDLQKEIERTKRISDDILDGLDKGEFYPVYQPQFDAQTLELIGVEALARWRHPILGDLAPPAFLEAAKELGAADSIDQAILEASLIDMEDWEARGVPIGRLAVNVSAQRIANPYLINLLKKLNVPHGRLSFEIHESTMLDHTNEDLRQRIRDICDLGIDIEIDNFGTGQSSFLGMWSAAPKRVKIDRELVRPIASSPEHKRLLEAIIDMGRSINLEVVSEGVETAQHIKILRKLGCHVLQGYALAKPMPAHELVEFAYVNHKFTLREGKHRS